MKSRWCRSCFFAVTSILLALALTLVPSMVAQESDQSDQEENDAQMVRLSYVQGDVRISYAIRNRDDLNKQWETAIANTALDEGYALATGKDGRAEIEFENGSVGYLAENSILIFDELATLDAAPVTRLKLLTGTAAFSTQLIASEEFTLLVPGDEIKIPSGMFFRADSYLDGFIMTPIRGNADGMVVYVDGKRAKAEGVKPPSAPADWNNWVLARQESREAAIPAAMKAAGVTTPFPGLLDLYRQGRFFPCEPYGECWAPIKERTFSVYDCLSGESRVRETTLKNVQTGEKRRVSEALDTNDSYYAHGPWLACNWGSWIDYDTWVFEPWMIPGHYPRHRNHDGDRHRGHDGHHDGDHRGPRHHPGHRPGGPRHHPPGHWVKTDGKTGFVPRHPNDAKGKPPVNLKNGMFVFKDGPATRVPVQAQQVDKVKILRDPPRNVRKIEVAERHQAAPPAILGRVLGESTQRNRDVAAKSAPPRNIQYDYHSKKFVDRDSGKPGSHDKPLFGLDKRGGVVENVHRNPAPQGSVFGRHDARDDSKAAAASNGSRPSAPNGSAKERSSGDVSGRSASNDHSRPNSGPRDPHQGSTARNDHSGNARQNAGNSGRDSSGAASSGSSHAGGSPSGGSSHSGGSSGGGYSGSSSGSSHSGSTPSSSGSNSGSSNTPSTARTGH